MARFAGVELQDNWRVIYALTNVKGIGWYLAQKIMDELKMDDSRRISDLSTDELATVAAALDKYPLIEGELVRNVKGNVQRLEQVGSYRGMRHHRNLPSRGQRTKTNARTKRGKRKTVGAFKKEMLAKQTQGAAQETK